MYKRQASSLERSEPLISQFPSYQKQLARKTLPVYGRRGERLSLIHIWEKAESALQREAFTRALDKAGLSQMCIRDRGVLHTTTGTLHADNVVVASHFPFMDKPGFYFARVWQERCV